MGFKSGIVTIAGRPNVGKSTLLNAILGRKLAIVSPKPQTTRNRIAGIAEWEDCQVVFLDTPGLHQGHGSLNQVMMDIALSALHEGDAVVAMIDASRTPREGLSPADEDVLSHVLRASRPTIVAINKIDAVRKDALLPLMDLLSKKMNPAALVPISALTGDGLDRLVSEVRALMPEGERLYPPGELTDRSRDFIITELVREKIFLLTREEVPYSVAVSLDHTAGSKVTCTIHVERTSQKGILVGKQGRMVKAIGEAARKEIEAFLGGPMYLELFVRVDKDWTRTLRGLSNVGFKP